MGDMLPGCCSHSKTKRMGWPYLYMAAIVVALKKVEGVYSRSHHSMSNACIEVGMCMLGEFSESCSFGGS